MKGLGALTRCVGRLLLRCLVGKYGTILWTSALAVVVGAGTYLSLAYDDGGSSGAHQGTVYSVAEIDAHLAQDPGSWLGRTLQVRGEVVPCALTASLSVGPCAELTSADGEPYATGQATTPQADTLPAALLSQLTPSSPTLHWGVVATYRVQLLAIPDSVCGASACAEANLLDSAP
jgi:hypothetical protein